jgi:hypothetical protein
MANLKLTGGYAFIYAINFSNSAILPKIYFYL